MNPPLPPAKHNLGLRATLFILFVACSLHARAADPAPLRAGMIGLDTSHVPAFAKIFNNPKATGDLAAIRIVAGYPGGTDIPASRDRVKGFTEQLRGMGIEIVDSIPKLLEKVDVVLLESVDGRVHLQEATPVIQAGKPQYFITANLHYAMLTSQESRLTEVNDRAAFIVADGMPLVWASRWQAAPIHSRTGAVSAKAASNSALRGPKALNTMAA